MPPDFAQFPLLAALRQRRSRRFALGMGIPGGPLEYQSRHAPRPLSEEEEAALVFAGCGVTGHALADLCYASDGGGNIMAGLAARTIASGDGLQTVALAVINDEAAYLVRRPRELANVSVRELAAKAEAGAFVELYRASRIKIKEGRVARPMEPLFNINANRWSAHASGASYFLPINDLTFMCVNGLLEILNEHTRAFIVDERRHFLPAGLGAFARRRGGHLEDDPAQGRVMTIRQLEQFVTEFVSLEQGMMLQNLALMTEALGLGGFPNFANHEFGWFQALGFRMGEMTADRYLGAGPWASLGMKLTGRNPMISYPVGLEREGEVLLKPFCPPYYGSMTEAVRAVVEVKFGADGVFRSKQPGAWSPGLNVAGQTPAISEAAIAATCAFCEYVWERYGRFPCTMAPYRTGLGFQAGHPDIEFYDKFYRPEAVGERQREDFARSIQAVAKATIGSSVVKTASKVQPSSE